VLLAVALASGILSRKFLLHGSTIEDGNIALTTAVTDLPD
jgi:hypothetical protein